MKTKKCRACGKEFVPAMYKQSAEYCNDPECRKRKLKISRKYERNIENIECEDDSKEKGYRRSNRANKSSGRVCRKCGKDPYPNYFYCPICHKSVRLDDEYEEMEYKF